MRVEVLFILFVYFEEMNFGKFVSIFNVFYKSLVFVLYIFSVVVEDRFF